MLSTDDSKSAIAIIAIKYIRNKKAYLLKIAKCLAKGNC